MEAYFTERRLDAKNPTYEVEGRKINYVAVGDESLPTVVFFHGAPGSWSAFKDFLADSTLLSSAHLISVDRPGYGYSDFGQSEPSLKRQAQSLKPLLEKYKSTPTHLVGHSLGGPVIAKIAMEYPELVSGLVMVAPSIDPDLEPEEDWFRVPMRSPFLSWIVPTSFLVTNEEIYFLEDQLRQMLPQWSEIKTSVTVIQGGADQLVDPGNAKFAETALKNANVTMVYKEKMNHFVPWNRPELITEAILGLIKEQRVTSATLHN